MSYRIGIDLGGTKIEIIAIDENGKPLIREKVSTPNDNYLGIIDAINTLVTQAEKEIGQKCSVGVSMPGAISPFTGFIKNSNTQCLIGKPFDKDLSNKLKRPVRLSNDANCFTLSEAIDGAGKGQNIVFGVIIGTGVGGGIVINKQVIKGVNGIAGEWGHNPLPWPMKDELPGPLCYCGKKGCLETYLSGQGMANDFYLISGEKKNPLEIVKMCETENDSAKICINQYISRFSRGLASVINVLDPDVIVFGGGLSNIEFLYSQVPIQLSDYVFTDHINTPIKKAAYGDSSGVRGAAWLWK